jgi:hypothetical protein
MKLEAYNWFTKKIARRYRWQSQQTNKQTSQHLFYFIDLLSRPPLKPLSKHKNTLTPTLLVLSTTLSSVATEFTVHCSEERAGQPQPTPH